MPLKYVLWVKTLLIYIAVKCYAIATISAAFLQMDTSLNTPPLINAPAHGEHNDTSPNSVVSCACKLQL